MISYEMYQKGQPVLTEGQLKLLSFTAWGWGGVLRWEVGSSGWLKSKFYQYQQTGQRALSAAPCCGEGIMSHPSPLSTSAFTEQLSDLQIWHNIGQRRGCSKRHNKKNDILGLIASEFVLSKQLCPDLKAQEIRHHSRVLFLGKADHNTQRGLSCTFILQGLVWPGDPGSPLPLAAQERSGGKSCPKSRMVTTSSYIEEVVQIYYLGRKYLHPPVSK